MSIVTSQQIARYYDQFHGTEVTFNKQVATATGLVARNVYLKIKDRQHPCVVFSSSMEGARVIASVTPPIEAAIRAQNNHVSLRWCFKQPDKVEPLTFFVPSTVAGFTRYSGPDSELRVIALQFVQRPSDDLIYLVGTLLEASINAKRRREERIDLSTDVLKKLGLESREAALLIERASFRCALRDLSFSGARVLTAGSAGMFTDRALTLKITKGEAGTEILLPAVVRRAEEVGGHKDIVALGLEFQSEPPLTYSLMVSTYLSTVRRPAGGATAAAPAAAAPAPAPTDAAPAAPPAVEPAEVPDEEPAPGSSPDA